MTESVECALVGCDQQFEKSRKGGGHRRRFCSVECKNKHKNRVVHDARLAARTDLICAAADCDNHFTPKRSDALYCSDACKGRVAAGYDKREPSIPTDPWGEPLPHGGVRRAALYKFADAVARGDIR